MAGGGRQPEDRGRIPTHRVEDGRPYRAQGRRPLGILDAVHVRRSHRDRRGRDQLQEGGHTYITVVVDHKRRRVVWAHDGYGKEVPGLFFRQPTDEQRASIKAVTGDGAKWIDASVKERLPNAGRVPDSFHIVSRMSDAPDQVRKRVRNQARRGNDKTATEAMRGVRYAVPKNPEDLTERQDTDPRGQPYLFHKRSFAGVSMDEFIGMLDDYMVWYRDKRIKTEFGMSIMDRRRELGLVA